MLLDSMPGLRQLGLLAQSSTGQVRKLRCSLCPSGRI